MRDLYVFDQNKKFEEVNRQLQDYIEICYLCPRTHDEIDTSAYKVGDKSIQNYLEVKKKGLQIKIDKHTNLQAYNNHKANHKETLAKQINNLFNQHIIHLDATEKAFVSSFADNYQKNVFELIMADFIKNQFTLQPRLEKGKSSQSGKADIELVHNRKTYFLECTTRNSSLMDAFTKQLHEFDLYLEAAQILQDCKTQLEKNEFGWGAGWDTMAEHLWHRLDASTQQCFMNVIKKTSAHTNVTFDTTHPLYFKQIIGLINNWSDLNLYAWFYFRNILPPALIQNMKQIITPCMSPNMAEFSQFLVESIVKMIIRKLENRYFQNNTPVILALSLSTLPDFMLTPMAFNSFESIASSIANELRNNIRKYIKDEEKIKLVSQKIKSLYAVIIDTTWYNWIPDFVEKMHGAQWPDPSCKNNYIILYNSSICNTLSYDHHIFMPTIKNYSDLQITIDET